MMVKLVVFFMVVAVSKSLGNKCNVPPEFWCGSEKVARHCQTFYGEHMVKLVKFERNCIFPSQGFLIRTSPHKRLWGAEWTENTWLAKMTELKKDVYARTILRIGEHTSRATEVTEQCHRFYEPNADKVRFALYYESMCPGCRDFFRTQLTKTYAAVKDIMDLTLVPYGNAWEKKDASGRWNFTCQHGEDECVGNLIQTCAIHLLKNISVYFPFISCIEHDQFGTPQFSAKKCAKQQGIDLQPIMDCSTSSLGNSLEHQMALKTEALNPPHEYVPWVTLNGVHTEEIQKKAEGDLTALICDTYKGSSKPAACNKKTGLHHSRRKL